MKEMFRACVVLLILFTAITILNAVRGDWTLTAIWSLCALNMAQTSAIIKLLMR